MNEKSPHSYDLEPTVEQYSQELLNGLLTQTKYNLEQHLHQNCGESHSLVGLCVGFMLSPKTAEDGCAEAKGYVENQRYCVTWQEASLENGYFEKLMSSEKVDTETTAEAPPANLLSPKFVHTQVLQLHKELKSQIPENLLVSSLIDPFLLGFVSKKEGASSLFAVNACPCRGGNERTFKPNIGCVYTGAKCPDTDSAPIED
jgi:hypothetical protein